MSAWECLDVILRRKILLFPIAKLNFAILGEKPRYSSFIIRKILAIFPKEVKYFVNELIYKCLLLRQTHTYSSSFYKALENLVYIYIGNAVKIFRLQSSAFALQQGLREQKTVNTTVAVVKMSAKI